MAIGTFCTTLCTALATLAAVPAWASGPAPAPHAAIAATTGDAYRNLVTPRQFAERTVLDTTTFDLAGRPAMLVPPALPGTDGSADPVTQFWQTATGGTASHPYGPEELQPAPETGNLPLLGAAAIALLVAQLRRSRWPTV
ncbi:hypothetical protein GJV26_10950 [Massilia dura]|uniref:PEP-CTERM sorting domain-containing protein n=1 Tax=Pseudoduganella dura TaxID=321982 RepID=A0A6I3XIG3_9BURK|nr:hypothetical protein [Pseudoduganella dura]MUI12972.1 hypothetical protein [Pseudoduganella dura]GGX88192.1 hypothetical protein GCM10007386_18830 [Pseudoduganella dura]